MQHLIFYTIGFVNSGTPGTSSYLADEYKYDWLRLEAGSDRSASDSVYEPVSAP